MHPAIYKEGKEVTYVVELRDSTNSVFCLDTIRLVMPKKRFIDLRHWVFDQISMNFEYAGACLPETTETTGIADEEGRLYLHPPRLDKMIVTESGPFPVMQYPAKLGAGAKSTRTILKGYVEWDGSVIISYDSVVRIIDTTISGNAYKDLAFRNGVSPETTLGPVYTSDAFSEYYRWVSGKWQFDPLSIYMHAVEYNW